MLDERLWVAWVWPVGHQLTTNSSTALGAALIRCGANLGATHRRPNGSFTVHLSLPAADVAIDPLFIFSSGRSSLSTTIRGPPRRNAP
jgi:hypothetical protein